MNMTTRWSLMAAMIGVTSLLLAACGSGDEDPSGSVAVGLDGSPISLDAPMDTSLGAAMVDAQIYDTLMQVGEDGEVEPGLVEDWEQPSPTSYTLTIREGVTFHDGTELDADAVKFNLDRARDPESGSLWAGTLEPIESVDVAGPQEVEISLTRPYAPLLAALATQAGMIGSPTAIKSEGDKFGHNPVGTGPYKFDEWQKDVRIALTANEDYWDGAPAISEAEFRPVPEPTTKITDLISDQLQTVDYVPPAQIADVEGAGGLVYEAKPASYANVTWLGLNPNEPPLDDPKVRQALSLLIDRETMVESIVFGAGVPARSLLAPGSWAYSEEVPALEFDPEEARRLLGGKQLEIEMKVPPTYTQQAQVLKESFAEGGVQLKIVEEDWGRLIEDYYDGNFQIEFQDLLGTPLYDPDMVLSGFYSPAGALNGTGFEDPRMTRLLEQGQKTEDQERRKGIYLDAQVLGQELMPYIPIYYPDNTRAWSDSLEGDLLPSDGLLHLADVTQK